MAWKPPNANAPDFDQWLQLTQATQVLSAAPVYLTGIRVVSTLDVEHYVTITDANGHPLWLNRPVDPRQPIPEETPFEPVLGLDAVASAPSGIWVHAWGYTQ